MDTLMTEPSKETVLSKEIAEDLLRLGAIKFNVSDHFTWVSGIKSPVYCDNRKVNSNVAARQRVIAAFVHTIEKNFQDVDLIAGVATGGIPFGALIAYELDLPFIYVRQEKKEHGLMRQVEGDFNKGGRVVVIEDHISTGGSSMRAVQNLKQEGLNVLGLISIMTYNFDKARELFSKEGIQPISLCDLDMVLEVALATGRISKEEKATILAFRDSVKF
jgi:orotate phosphoribosyltransferase